MVLGLFFVKRTLFRHSVQFRLTVSSVFTIISINHIILRVRINYESIRICEFDQVQLVCVLFFGLLLSWSILHHLEPICDHGSPRSRCVCKLYRQILDRDVPRLGLGRTLNDILIYRWLLPRCSSGTEMLLSFKTNHTILMQSVTPPSSSNRR